MSGLRIIKVIKCKKKTLIMNSRYRLSFINILNRRLCQSLRLRLFIDVDFRNNNKNSDYLEI